MMEIIQLRMGETIWHLFRVSLNLLLFFLYILHLFECLGHKEDLLNKYISDLDNTVYLHDSSECVDDINTML